MSKEHRFTPIHDPKLVEELKHKQSSIDALLSLTKSIIGNQSTVELFRIFVDTLREKFNYSNVFFLYKTKTGWFVLHNDQHKHLKDLNLLEFLAPFTELTYLEEDEAVMGEFDTIVPVIYEEKPLAYLMVEGVYNKIVDSVEEEVRFLETYTNIVVIAAENQRLLKQEIQQEYEKKELKMAAEIQQSLVPSSFPDLDCCSFAAEYIPHHEIGGDGFDIFYHKPDNSIYVTMADVSGKGVSAALLMANFQATLRQTLINSADGTSFSKEINKAVHEVTKGDRFISLFVGKIFFDQKKIRYVNFGHNPPFLKIDGEVQRLDKGSTIIGVFEDLPFIDIGEVHYHSKAELFVFTDGIIDVINDKKERFGVERLEEFIKTNTFKSAQDMNNKIIAAIENFKGKEDYNDDVTCLSTFIH